MLLKIKIGKGNYALRTYDKNGIEIFYTSSRLGGFDYSDDELICNVPDGSVKYELKELNSLKIIQEGEIKKIKGDKNVSN
ncbi:hypothetical protein [Rosettibacter firmus]|uniref:hypothetical protein n=1 Tax=Rosettibacter firmus TaxID=3111522 RepID=UPI00336C1A23